MRHPLLLATVVLVAATAVVASRAAAPAPVLEDPTRPSDARGARAMPGWPQLQLQGILCHGTSRVAIIDGRLVHSGDRLGDALIGAIDPDAVHYLRGGHELIAYMTKSSLQVRRLAAQPKDSP
jgi:hypothetical protein